MTDAEASYRRKLLQLPRSEADPREYRRDRVYGYLMILAGVATSVILIFGWALPYNR